MKTIELIDEEFNDEPRLLRLVPDDEDLQLQIESEGNNAYIDLVAEEAFSLQSRINEWLVSINFTSK